MKTLIYTTAFGEEHFFLLAEQMIRSLRKRGYQGEVAVITDRPHTFDAQLEARVFILPEVGASPLIKAQLHRMTDISAYERILFVDSDVVFLGDPAPLFALSGERIMLSRDHCPLSRNSFNLTFFSPAERRVTGLASTRSINTGVIVFPGSRYIECAEHWLKAWGNPEVRQRLASIPTKHGELRDQPVMQRLVTCGGLDCGFIPDNLLLMPLFFTENQPLHPDTVLLHLNGTTRTEAKKRALLGIMEECTAANTHEDFRRICDRLQAERRRSVFPVFPEPHSGVSSTRLADTKHNTEKTP